MFRTLYRLNTKPVEEAEGKVEVIKERAKATLMPVEGLVSVE
jgi:hypothetical protein